MATVDFTKDELKSELLASMRVMMVDEREYTRAMIRESAEDVKYTIATEIRAEMLSFVQDNFNPAIDSLQEQISEIRRGSKGDDEQSWLRPTAI